MPINEPTTNPPRMHIVPLLAQRFFKDYDAAVQSYPLPQQLELTEHLLHVLTIFRKYQPDEQESIFVQYREKEEALLKKYGKTVKPYFDRQFHGYFYFEMVLADKGIFESEVFNNLPGDQQGLTLDEIHQFIQVCHNNLSNAKIFLYLQMEPEAAAAVVPEPAEPDNEMTKARQLLAIFYLLKTGFAIEHRDTHSVSAVAQLVHLLTGTKFTTTQNSDIYKKYASMPNYNKGEQLIADLQFIQPYFNRLNMQEAVQLIEEEINRAIKDLPAGARNKYRNKEI